MLPNPFAKWPICRLSARLHRILCTVAQESNESPAQDPIRRPRAPHRHFGWVPDTPLPSFLRGQIRERRIVWAIQVGFVWFVGVGSGVYVSTPTSTGAK